MSRAAIFYGTAVGVNRFLVYSVTDPKPILKGDKCQLFPQLGLSIMLNVSGVLPVNSNGRLSIQICIKSGTNYFWSEAAGQIDLSQTSAPETGCQPPILAVSENNGVFVLWIEESDVAGEGLDIFGGWIEGANFDAYLPMIVR